MTRNAKFERAFGKKIEIRWPRLRATFARS